MQGNLNLEDTKNILFLASGRGTNFQSFVDHLRLGILKNVRIKGVISNHFGAPVLQKARAANIEIYEIEGVAGKKFSSREEKDKARLRFDNECVSICKSLGIDFVLLAGFDQILTTEFTQNFPYRILNIHPAYDLRVFGGKNMVGTRVHELVISQRMKYSGCSVHLVTDALDQGPVILKRRVQVIPNDTPETLESRILEQEHLAYPEALQLLVDGRVIVSEKGDRCFVDKHSNSWDIEWAERQESYLNYVKSHILI
jgi:phosphoribosylglycinamide formyltransferase-1